MIGDSSALLFTRAFKTCSHKSDDITPKPIIELKLKVSWCQACIWTPLGLNMVFVMDKSSDRTPLRVRSGGHSCRSRPYRSLCRCQSEHWSHPGAWGSPQKEPSLVLSLMTPKRVDNLNFCPKAEGGYPLVNWGKPQCAGTEPGYNKYCNPCQSPLAIATPEWNRVQPLSKRLVLKPLLCIEVRPTISNRNFSAQKYRVLSHQRGDIPDCHGPCHPIDDAPGPIPSCRSCL